MKRTAIRRLGLVFLGVLALMFVPGFVLNGSSQSSWMTPAYSVYTSYSSDGTHIYTSVTVSGTTNGTCPTQPAQLANECHSTTHTPKVYNLLGSVGGWKTGNSVYWNSYLSMGNNQQIAATAGVDYTFAASAEVMCNFIGNAIYSATSTIKVGVHFYAYEYSGPEQGSCVYFRCNTGSGPCYQFTIAPSEFNPPVCPTYVYVQFLTATAGGYTGCFELNLVGATKCLADQ